MDTTVRHLANDLRKTGLGEVITALEGVQWMYATPWLPRPKECFPSVHGAERSDGHFRSPSPQMAHCAPEHGRVNV